MSCNAGALTVGTRAAFAGDDLFCEQTMAALVAGVSTRTFIDAILDEGLACQ